MPGPTLVTASTMILSSCRMIGTKAPGGTLTSAEQTDFLYDLNASMDSWGIDRSMCYQLLQESFALTVDVGSYTIGPGGAFDTVRPNEIADPCYCLEASTGLRFPLRIAGAQEFGRFQYDLSNMDTYPGAIFYDHAFVAGLGKLWLFLKPIAGLTLYINSWKQLQTFGSISAPLMLPPGYQLMIESNFAIRLAGGLTKVSAEVASTAKESMLAVKRMNEPNLVLRYDPAVSMLGGGSGSSLADFIAGT